MRLFRWLKEKTCYTFAIAMLSVMGGQVASFYGYFYFHFYIQHEGSMWDILPLNMVFISVFLLFVVSVIHYVIFGGLRALGHRCELRRLRIINDNVCDSGPREGMNLEALSDLLEALSRFPLWNTLAGSVLGFAYFSTLLVLVVFQEGGFQHSVLGLRAGMVSLLTYVYITFVISDFLTATTRSNVKKAIHSLGGQFEDRYVFSLKGKFISFVVFILLSLTILSSFSMSFQSDAGDRTALAIFAALSLAISSFLAVLFFTSFFRAINEVRVASEELAAGRKGYIFSGSLDKEFVLLNRTMIATAEEVNQYRSRMESLVQEKTRDLEQSLERLHSSEKRFRALVEHGSDVITVIGPEGARVYESPSMERVLGYSRKEIHGKNAFELIHPDDRTRVMEDFEKGLHVPGLTMSTEYRFRHKNGSWRNIKATGMNLLHDPAVGGVVVNSRDITDRARAEEQLQKSISLLRATLESTADGILVVNREGKIESFNRQFSEMWRIPEAVMASGDDDRALAFVLDQLKDPEAFVTKVRELYDREKDDSYDLLEFTDGRVFERYSKPQMIGPKAVGRVWSFRDITERKQAEDALREHKEHLSELVAERTAELEQEINERTRIEEKIRTLNEALEHRVQERTAELEKAFEELKRLDEMKDSFLSSVSHELRTPLTSIRSFAEILIHYDEEDPETRKEFLEIIRVESERLTRLINDVLDLSRIEAGKMVYNDELVFLEEVIQEVARSQHQLLSQKLLHLHLDFDPGLPPLYVDRDRVVQVVTNLIGNAIKFSFEGGEIDVRAERFEGKRSGESSEWVRLRVSDQGVGVEEKDAEIIFDKFRQVCTDTLKDKPRGTGLGLPICKDIVCHYGGDIWVENRQGQGSTFVVTLPGADPSASHAEQSTISEAPGDPVSPFPRRG